MQLQFCSVSFSYLPLAHKTERLGEYASYACQNVYMHSYAYLYHIKANQQSCRLVEDRSAVKILNVLFIPLEIPYSFLCSRSAQRMYFGAPLKYKAPSYHYLLPTRLGKTTLLPQQCPASRRKSGSRRCRAFCPQAMRIHCVSDLHTDYKENLDW